ncbi:MAG: DinB family protein [Chloroflexota bacterium]
MSDTNASNPSPSDSLMIVYEGWDGYRQSIINAVAPLTIEQLAWRPAAHLRSVGELVRHIALGPIDWFLRMDAPGSHELAGQIEAWEEDPHGNRYVVEDAIPLTGQAAELVRWLEASWQMIEQTLNTWTVADLQKTYRHVWRGSTYAVSRQWTIWRIMAHDIHHGGELAIMLGAQGIEIFELGDLGGHIIEPPLVDR